MAAITITSDLQDKEIKTPIIEFEPQEQTMEQSLKSSLIQAYSKAMQLGNEVAVAAILEALSAI